MVAEAGAESGAEAEVEAPEVRAEVTMAPEPVKDEGPGMPPEASRLTLRR